MKRARRLKSTRFLPVYVTEFRDVRGKQRLRFRRKGFADHYFKAALGTEEFRAEYARCLDPAITKEAMREAAAARMLPGSIGELEARYIAVPERLGPSVVTQEKIKAVIASFCEGRRERRVASVTFEHLDSIIAKRRVKTGTGNKTTGGIEAARKLRKELVRLFDFAVKCGYRADNPAEQAERVRVPAGERSKGYHTWAEAEIAQYRERHIIGSKPRLAPELLLWTGTRRSEARTLGRQSVRAGRIRVEQGKTGKMGWIAMAPQLVAAITAMPPTDSMCFLVSEKGTPFAAASFGNKMREWCDQAGLPHCAAHGLRKAIMRRMADLGESNQTMKAVSLHSKDDEVARYTAAANQERLAATAITALSEWELTSIGSAPLDVSAC